MNNKLGSQFNPIVIDSSDDEDENGIRDSEVSAEAKSTIKSNPNAPLSVSSDKNRHSFKRQKLNDNHKSPLNCLKSPFRLFSTVQDEVLRKNLSTVSDGGRQTKIAPMTLSQSEIRSRRVAALEGCATSDSERDRHSSRNYESDSHLDYCLTLRQFVGVDVDSTSSIAKGPIEWIVIVNYIIDFDFLLDEIPELVSIPKVVFFFQVGDPTPYKNNMPNAEFYRLDPSKEPSSALNPLRHKFPYGTHHTKMFLVGFQQFVRVVIHTSNLIHNDIYLKAQGSYVQDFPLKTNDSQLQCEFEQTLVSYLSSYGYNKKNKWSAYGDNITLNDQIARYDFDLALVKLIPSIPGYYNFPEKCNAQGYLRLKSMISEFILSKERKDNKLGPIVCQFSSIGSLSEKWLRDFASSLSADTEKDAVGADKLMLVYPTVEEIRTSMEGYAGGASVPGKSKNLRKAFIGPLLHKWSGGSRSIHKPSNVPHIKTYYQLSKDKDSLEWFVLTSHNLSKAAWGEVINSQYGKCLRTLSWEMGVFCCPKLVGDQQLVPFDMRNDPGSFVIPLPYQTQPERYGVDDQPWAVDEKYEKSDAFGNY